MSENIPELPNPKAGGILKRKALGIPVLYIAALFVVMIAAYAYKSKKSTAAPADTSATPAVGDLGAVSTDESGNPTTGDAVPTLDTGTVYATSTTPPVEPDPSVLADNDTWLKQGISWAAANGILETDAQVALQAYLNGADLTYTQGQIVNKVLAQFGPPPTLPTGTKIASAPAQTQGSPPLTHTVQGANDNTYTAIAQLYYHRADEDTIDLLQGVNADTLGASGPWPVGSRVKVPVYHVAKYYVATTTTRTLATIAAKNGVSQEAVTLMNDGHLTFPVAVGTKVRVA